MKISSVFLPLIVAVLLTIPLDAGAETKRVTSLDTTEKGALNALLIGIFKETTGSMNCFYYETTFYYMPLPGGATDEKLDPPLALPSCACIGPFMMMPETISKLEHAMRTKGVEYSGPHGRKFKLEILSGFVHTRTGGGGGSYGMTNDMATIIPTTILIRD